MAEIAIAGHRYPVAAESLLPKGRRAYRRGQARLSTLQDPAWSIVREWRLAGPIGLSRQRADGLLGCDFATLEHRYPERLMSLGAVSTLTLTTPPNTSPAMLGTSMMLGTRMLGGGTSLTTPQNVSHIRESQSDRLFAARGAFVTQINPSTWTEEAVQILATGVRGMAMWFNKLRLGMGPQKALQTVTNINSSGATYSDTQVSGSDVLAKELVEGNNRLWMVQADSAGTNENRLRYTLDDFASISNSFVVGDPGVSATGLGRMGPYTVVGGERGILSFTDDGFPQHLVEALRDTVSAENGRKQAWQFGWDYVISALGLYALRPGVSNPVGIGSQSMRGFEGFDGRPVAVRAWRESLFVAWENSAGDTWRILEGVFNPAFTDATGELDWYMLATRTNAAIREIGATAVPTLPTIVWGEGTGTLARIAKGRGGRDISDSSYTYSTAGGQWFGSTLMEHANLRKTIRQARFFTRNMAAGNSWRFAISFDEGAYENVGSAVTTAGPARVAPDNPLLAPTGFLPKPRLTQVAGASDAATTPPELVGTLEIAFDLRPERVDDVTVVLAPLTREQVAALRELSDGGSATGKQPVEIRLPDETGLRHGYVTDVEEQDAAADAVLGASVRIVLWELG